MEGLCPRYEGGEPPQGSVVAALYTSHLYKGSGTDDIPRTLSMNIYAVVILALNKKNMYSEDFYVDEDYSFPDSPKSTEKAQKAFYAKKGKKTGGVESTSMAKTKGKSKESSSSASTKASSSKSAVKAKSSSKLSSRD